MRKDIYTSIIYIKNTPCIPEEAAAGGSGGSISEASSVLICEAVVEATAAPVVAAADPLALAALRALKAARSLAPYFTLLLRFADDALETAPAAEPAAPAAAETESESGRCFCSCAV